MSKKLNIHTGAMIAELRSQAGYTQSQLASALGRTRTSICNIELGRQALSIDLLLKCCAVLKCRPEAILPPVPKVMLTEGVRMKRVLKDKTLTAKFKY